MRKRKQRWISVTQAHVKKLLVRNAKKDDVMKDYISRLPTDILIHIVSYLSVKEAVRTRVLSNRWKHVSTHITSMNFDASKELLNLKNLNLRNEVLEEERSNYIKWVNKALELHRGSNVIRFRVRFDLNTYHKKDITKWIYTAMAMELQEFELNLHDFDSNVHLIRGFIYHFPIECYNYLKSPSGLYSIRNLRSLVLDTVDVTRDVIEFFIQNCPLERLCVAKSIRLSGIKVGLPSRLKHLEIIRCFLLEEVVISTPSLLSFKFAGSRRNSNFDIKNVTQLVDVAIFGNHMPFFDAIKRFVTQLRTLELGIVGHQMLPIPFLPCELPKLQHLELDVYTYGLQSFDGFTRIINACPFLQKLTVKLTVNGIESREKRTEIHSFPKCPHRHLRLVEFIGFLGLPIDVEFALYLCENATMLERIIVQSATTKGHAKLILEKMVPEGVELIIY